MLIALTLGRIALSLVFLVAGVAKLLDRPGSRQAMVDFGAPQKLAGPLGVALPVAELAVTVALMPYATAFWGAVGALSLLVGFLVGIGVNLARGKKPDCHCFGQLHSEPIGAATVVRNLVLAGVAGALVLKGPGVALSDLWSGVTAAQVTVGVALAGLSAVVALLAWFVVQLTAQQGRLLLRIEALEEGRSPEPSESLALPPLGLPVGSPAPDFRLPSLSGGEVSLKELLSRGKPLLLVFTDPNCGACDSLLPEVAAWQCSSESPFEVALISRGSVADNARKLERFRIEDVLLQAGAETSEKYGIGGTPGAVVVLPSGVIGSPVAMGVDFIHHLASGNEPSRAMSSGAGGRFALPRWLNVGDAAPSLHLPDINGQIVDLEDLRGQSVLVLFWNPSCGFCQKMLPSIKSWEANPPVGSPQLVVVSSGSIEINRAMGLSSLVMLDNDHLAMFGFGAMSTPSAVLLDKDGIVLQVLVSGSAAVMHILLSSASSVEVGG